MILFSIETSCDDCSTLLAYYFHYVCFVNYGLF